MSLSTYLRCISSIFCTVHVFAHLDMAHLHTALSHRCTFWIASPPIKIQPGGSAQYTSKCFNLRRPRAVSTCKLLYLVSSPKQESGSYIKHPAQAANRHRSSTRSTRVARCQHLTNAEGACQMVCMVKSLMPLNDLLDSLRRDAAKWSALVSRPQPWQSKTFKNTSLHQARVCACVCACAIV